MTVLNHMNRCFKQKNIVYLRFNPDIPPSNSMYHINPVAISSAADEFTRTGAFRKALRELKLGVGTLEETPASVEPSEEISSSNSAVAQTNVRVAASKQEFVLET